MTTTLSNFANLFTADLVEQGKNLFEKKMVHSLTQKKYIWTAEIKEKKTSKMEIRIVNNEVTDVFCTCQPDTCRHIIAMLFALQQQLKITADPHDPSIQPQLKRDDIIDERLIRYIQLLNAGEKDDSNLVALRKELLTELYPGRQLRALVTEIDGDVGYHPRFIGAEFLLDGTAIDIKGKLYRQAFSGIQAVITELCNMGLWYNHSVECGHRAIGQIGELLSGASVPLAVKQEVFTWSIVVSSTVLYKEFRRQLIDMLQENTTDPEQQKLLLEFIEG